MKNKFRKFMVKYLMGISSYSFTFKGKKYYMSWLKGAPYFYLSILLLGIITLYIDTETIKIILGLSWIFVIYILGFWYPHKYPLTEDEK